MFHHIYKLASSADFIHFPLMATPKRGAFKLIFFLSLQWRERCQLGSRRCVCKLLRGGQGSSSFNQGYKEVIKRWDLETCCCEVCALKWRIQRNCESKVQTWTLVHLHQCLSLDQQPTSKASLPVVLASCASFWLVEWINPTPFRWNSLLKACSGSPPGALHLQTHIQATSRFR